MKSQTRWTSCEDPQPASQPCCSKYAASGLWSTCQRSWSNLTRQEDAIAEQFAQQLANRLSKLDRNASLCSPSSFYLASWYKDRKTGQVRDSSLRKKCSVGSKIKLIIYSSRGVPFRALFCRVVSKKVTKKHFQCAKECRTTQPRNILSNMELAYFKVLHYSAVYSFIPTNLKWKYMN